VPLRVERSFQQLERAGIPRAIVDAISGGHEESGGGVFSLHLAEPPEQWIILLDEGHVPQPPAAVEQQPDDQSHHRHRSEVPCPSLNKPRSPPPNLQQERS
jgi:hypothetical protein